MPRQAALQAILTLCIVALSCASVRSQETNIPTLTPSQLGVEVTQWTIEEGLPIQIITSLAQTPDGFIWCGSFAGLIRFDGVRFRVFDNDTFPGLDDVLILQIFVDGTGALWLTGQEGELGRFDGDRVTRFGTAEGFREGGVRNGAVDTLGRLWFLSRRDSPFFHQDGNGGWTAITFQGITAQKVDTFCPIGDGSESWVITQKTRELQRVSTSAEPELAVVKIDDPRPSFGRFFRFPDGRLGVTSTRGSLVEEDGSWSPVFPVDPELSLKGGGMLDGGASETGAHWIANYTNGLLALTPSGRFGRLPLGLTGENFIRSLMRDSEGNIWAAKNDGLFRLRPTPFRNHSIEDGLTSPWIHSIAEDHNGTIWTTSGGNVYQLDPGSESFRQFEVPGKFDAMHLYPLSGDRMLITARNGDLRLWSGEGFVKLPTSGYVNGLAEDPDGRVWIGTRSGLCLLEGHRLSRVKVTSPPQPELIEDVRVDSKGTAFVSVYNVGVFRETDDGWENISDPNSPGTRKIITLYLDELDQLWAISRGNELLYYEGEHWKTSPSITGELPRGLRSVWSDRNGFLWIPSYRGVHQVERDFALGKIRRNKARKRTFFAEDGLGSSSLTNSTSGILGDSRGHLWVATQAGLSVANLEHIETASFSSSARPLLEEVILDQVEVLNAHDLSSGITLSPGNQLIELRYTATGLGNPARGAFRYRLNQSGGPWIEVGDQRQLFLPKPQPGDYTFELQARNSHGIWSKETLKVPIAVQPFWWDTLQAKLLLFSFLLLGVAMIFYARQKQMLQKQKSIEDFSRRTIRVQEEERRSVAEELHDSIGQELLVLKARVDLAKQKDQGSEGSGLLEEVSDSLSDSIQLVKELSRGLRPPLLEKIGLHSALEAMINEVSSASAIPISYSGTEKIDSLDEEIQIGVYRIVQEALNNMVHHSDASEATIQIHHAEDQFFFEISDDGRGFDHGSEATSSKGSGLTSIARRVSLLAGSLEIHSEPGEGTCISFQLPSSH